jgi:hypothetical protein
MKCPYCEYEATEDTEDRDKGAFWNLTNSVQLKRSSGFMEEQKAYVAGCPNCKRLFVDDYGMF